MKKLVAIFAGVVMFGLVAGKVLANEGILKLQPLSGFSGQCFAVSIYEDGMYRITATCRDLKVSYTPEGNYYVLWAVTADNKVYRLGEVERGKISTAIDFPFNKLFVTVENASYPRKASDQKVMEGSVEAIPFVGSSDPQPIISITPTVTPTSAPLIPVPGQKESWSLGRVLGVLGRIVGVGILVLVIAGVVLTVVTRRKES